jgi:hypothetical protein
MPLPTQCVARTRSSPPLRQATNAIDLARLSPAMPLRHLAGGFMPSRPLARRSEGVDQQDADDC